MFKLGSLPGIATMTKMYLVRENLKSKRWIGGGGLRQKAWFGSGPVRSALMGRYFGYSRGPDQVSRAMKNLTHIYVYEYDLDENGNIERIRTTRADQFLLESKYSRATLKKYKEMKGYY